MGNPGHLAGDDRAGEAITDEGREREDASAASAHDSRAEFLQWQFSSAEVLKLGSSAGFDAVLTNYVKRSRA
uniref:SAM-dependent methyltransferase n=1 Tax=Angiostrongylus cantonensis TaxID=6313 RepID=A0A0K0DDJ9_ANGCA